MENSELIWAVYGAIQAMEKSGDKSFKQLASRWKEWLDFTKSTIPIVRRPISGPFVSI